MFNIFLIAMAVTGCFIIHPGLGVVAGAVALWLMWGDE